MGHLLTRPTAGLRRVFWVLYAACYDQLWDMPVTTSVAECVVDLAPKDLPVVEVGAGTGLITQRLAQHRTVAIAAEPAPAMRRRLMAKGLPIGKVADATIDQLEPGSEPCCVVATNVLHLVDDPWSAEGRLQELAGPGGVVIVATPTDRATVTEIVRTALRRGAGVGWALGFLAAHLVLGPLAGLAGLPRHRRLAEEPADHLIDGIQAIHVLPGAAAPPRRSPSPSTAQGLRGHGIGSPP